MKVVRFLELTMLMNFVSINLGQEFSHLQKKKLLMTNTMERMMERINLKERAPPRENQTNPQNKNRNQDFRGDPPQIIQRENDQQIIPPFRENYVDEEERETEEPEK